MRLSLYQISGQYLLPLDKEKKQCFPANPSIREKHPDGSGMHLPTPINISETLKPFSRYKYQKASSE